MKTLAALAGLIVMAFAGIVFAPVERRSGPVPIVHGRDACDACRMRLDRPGFAAQVAREGGAALFDDIGCLARAGTGNDPSRIWVEDHPSGELVALASATLVRSDRMRTPMASGIVAFRDRSAADEHRVRMQGEIVTIDRLVAAARREDGP